MAYYRGAMGAIICYDSSEPQTLKNAERWIKDFKEKSNPNTPIVLAACKFDLIEAEEDDHEKNMGFTQAVEEESGENILA